MAAKRKRTQLDPHERFILNCLKAARQYLCKAEHNLANQKWGECAQNATQASIEATRIRDYLIREKLLK